MIRSFIEYKDGPNNMYLVIAADSLNEIKFLSNSRHCISFSWKKKKSKTKKHNKQTNGRKTEHNN